MLQRVQTLFLVAVVLCTVLSLFFPIWMEADPETNERVVLTALEMEYQKDDKLVTSTSTVFIAIFAFLGAGIAAVAIFLWSNRVLQMKVVLFNTLILCGLVGFMIFYNIQGQNIIEKNAQESYEFGYFLPLMALIANFFARRFIKKDEDLVRASNRMR